MCISVRQQNKVIFYTSGKVLFPLIVGSPAILMTDQGRVRTHKVEKITRVDRKMIEFETAHICYRAQLVEDSPFGYSK